MNKVSLIVPIYNAQDYLDKCINSLIKQTLKDIEIILINDGSTDNSVQQLEQCMNTYTIPYTILSYSQNQGKWYAIQYGIKNSTTQCDYFFLRDIDNATHLEEITNCIKKVKNSSYSRAKSRCSGI